MVGLEMLVKVAPHPKNNSPFSVYQQQLPRPRAFDAVFESSIQVWIVHMWIAHMWMCSFNGFLSVFLGGENVYSHFSPKHDTIP